jgi:FkbM family methyltransferase
MVSAANQLAVYKPGQAGFDSMLLDWARNLVSPGMNVWDVGANMGLFTFPAAALGAHLVSFEPDPFNLELLHSSRAMNPDLDVQVVPAAAAKTAGLATFNVSNRGRSTNGLAHVEQSTQTGGVRHTYNVMTVTLDAMLQTMPRPDLIKIDTEGAEIEVIHGADTILREVRPSWIIEIQASNGSEIWNIMSSANYSCFDAELAGYPARDSVEGVYNALFVPEERKHSANF